MIAIYAPQLFVGSSKAPRKDTFQSELELHIVSNLCETDLSFKMITRHITAVTTKFNPFSRDARTARIFLSMLPPNARTAMKIDTKILARDSKEPSTLHLKFSKCPGLVPLVPPTGGPVGESVC